MEDADRNRLRVATTITTRVSESVRALRAFAEVPGHRVVVVGNHDVEVWWNPRIQRSLREAGWSTCRGCRTRTRSASLPNSLSTVMHGNQFHPANSIVDYANPLDTPGGRVTAVSCRLGMGTSRPAARHLGGLVLPVSPEPGPPLNALRDGSGAIWCRHGRVSGGVKGARLAALGGLLDLLAQLGGTLLGPTRRPLPIALHGPDAAATDGHDHRPNHGGQQRIPQAGHDPGGDLELVQGREGREHQDRDPGALGQQ